MWPRKPSDADKNSLDTISAAWGNFICPHKILQAEQFKIANGLTNDGEDFYLEQITGLGLRSLPKNQFKRFKNWFLRKVENTNE